MTTAWVTCPAGMLSVQSASVPVTNVPIPGRAAASPAHSPASEAAPRVASTGDVYGPVASLT